MADEAPSLPVGGDGVAALMRRHDWSASALGPPAAWPRSLRTVADLMLGSRFPMFVAWGPELGLLYNDAYAPILGAKHPAALGGRFRDVWAEIWPEIAPLADRALAGGATYSEDLPLTMRRNGFDEATWFTFSYSPLRDDAGAVAGMLCVCTEATGKVRAETALRESEERHRNTVELNPQVPWTARPDGRLDHVSPRWFEWTGGTGLGVIWGEAVHPDDLEPSVAAWTRSVSTGEPYDIEHRVRLRDGAYRWMRSRAFPRRDEDGRILRWYGTTENVDGRKLAEARLLESRDRLASESRALEVLNRVGVQVAAELDLETLVQRVVDAGRELTGAQVGAFFYNVERDSEERFLLYALSGAEASRFEGFGMPRATPVFGPTFRGEGVVRSGDITRDPRYGRNPPHRGMPAGHLPVRSYLAVPVTSRSGEVLGGLLFGHAAPDVFGERAERLVAGLAPQAAIGIDNARLFAAAQRANETLEQRVEARTAELRASQEQLHQAQKMEAVGQLTGGIAHDFNNLLTGIIGSLEMIRTRIAQGRMDAVERYIGLAAASGRRAAALTHRLLAFARRQPLDPRPVQVEQLVASMEELLRRTLGEAVTLSVVPSEATWPTLCDPHQLENALLNLCINARDAMPGGGRLTVRTGNADLAAAPTAREAGVAPGQYVLVAVTDTGTGMTPEVAARAFDPFFTTKPAGQGTGLGLSMIYGFARQSEGAARISSAPGAGTTVTILLPRHLGETGVEAAQPVPEARTRAAGGERVLVVDDDPVVRSLVVEALRDRGYGTLEAEDGPSGLRLLESGERIDLLVSDIGLPGFNGRHLAERARARRPGLRVLFMTGYAAEAALPGGFLAPGMELITKPFEVEALAARLGRMLGAAPG